LLVGIILTYLNVILDSLIHVNYQTLCILRLFDFVYTFFFHKSDAIERHIITANVSKPGVGFGVGHGIGMSDGPAVIVGVTTGVAVTDGEGSSVAVGDGDGDGLAIESEGEGEKVNDGNIDNTGGFNEADTCTGHITIS
jgi:hypothetical protein